MDELNDFITETETQYRLVIAPGLVVPDDIRNSPNCREITVDERLAPHEWRCFVYPEPSEDPSYQLTANIQS